MRNATTVESVTVTYFDDCANRYKVPKKQWGRWSKFQRSMFNRVHSAMIHNSALFRHPEAEPIPASHWKTTAWNAAWEAASAASSLDNH